MRRNVFASNSFAKLAKTTLLQSFVMLCALITGLLGLCLSFMPKPIEAATTDTTKYFYVPFDYDNTLSWYDPLTAQIGKPMLTYSKEGTKVSGMDLPNPDTIFTARLPGEKPDDYAQESGNIREYTMQIEIAADTRQEAEDTIGGKFIDTSSCYLTDIKMVRLHINDITGNNKLTASRMYEQFAAQKMFARIEQPDGTVISVEAFTAVASLYLQANLNTSSLKSGEYRLHVLGYSNNYSETFLYEVYNWLYNAYVPFKIDLAAPTLQVSTTNGSTATSDTFTVQATDDYSGVDSFYMKEPGGSFTKVSNPITVNKEQARNGQYEFYATDVAGNESAHSYVYFDKAAPTMYFDEYIDNEVRTVALRENQSRLISIIKDHDYVIRASESESETGVKYLYVKKPGDESFSSVGSPWSFTVNNRLLGQYTFYAEDNGGNVSGFASIEFVDETPPTITGASTTERGKITNQEFTVTATDEGSGIAGFYVKAPNSSSFVKSAYESETITRSSTNGLYTFYAEDYAGNRTENYYVFFDDTPPTITGASMIRPTTKGTNKPTTVTASDSGSGLHTFYWKIPGWDSFEPAYGNFGQTNSEEVPLEGKNNTYINGLYTFYAVDNAGNYSEDYYIHYDDTAPTLTCSGASFSSSTSTGFTVKATSESTNIGTTTLYFSYNGGAWQKYSSNSFTLVNNSTTTAKKGKYSFYAIDATGNKSKEQWVILSSSLTDIVSTDSKDPDIYYTVHFTTLRSTTSFHIKSVKGLCTLFDYSEAGGVYDNYWYFYLENDLDFAGVDSVYGIGSEAGPFNGRFYGQKHTIKNLQTQQGMFAYISRATIQDFNFTNYMGGFVSTLSGNNIITNINVDSNKNNQSPFIGAILSGTTKISNVMLANGAFRHLASVVLESSTLSLSNCYFLTTFDYYLIETLANQSKLTMNKVYVENYNFIGRAINPIITITECELHCLYSYPSPLIGGGTFDSGSITITDSILVRVSLPSEITGSSGFSITGVINKKSETTLYRADPNFTLSKWFMYNGEMRLRCFYVAQSFFPQITQQEVDTYLQSLGFQG